MKNLLLISLFLLCLLPAYSQPADKSVPDSIRIAAIPFLCCLRDRPKDVRILSKNAVLMTAGKQTDLHNPADRSYYRHNAPKLLFTPDADFDFSALVKPEFEHTYDGGALLIYSDSASWAKILLQYTPDKKQLIGISVVRNGITDDSYYGLGNDKEVYLRLTKTGKVLNFFISSDKTRWQLLREFVYSDPGNLQIGFYTQSPTGSGCVVEFSNIAYRQIKN